MNRQKVIIILAIVALVIGLLSISASAAVDPDFSIPYSDGSSLDSMRLVSVLNGTSFYAYVSADVEVSGCWIQASGFKYIYFCSPDVCIAYVVSSSDGVNFSPVSSATLASSSVIDGTTYYRASINTNVSNFNSNSSVSYLPVEPDSNSALSACVSALNYTPPVATSDFSFDLPAGNVAVIQTGNVLTDVSLSSTMPVLSTTWLVGDEPIFWQGSATSFYYSDSAPVSGGTLSGNRSLLLWERGSDRDLLGRSNSAVKRLSFDSSNNGEYLVLFNYPYFNQGERDDLSSPTIHCVVEDAVSVVVYSVTVSASGSVLGEVTYFRTPEGTWEDSDGGNSAPPVGGGNYVPEDGDLFSVLSGLVSDIDQFFRGTWSYIRDLVSVLSTFPNTIVSIYNWLPLEFRGLLLSCFSICCCVGVLKVLL